MAVEKIEAVKKVTQALKQEPLNPTSQAEGLERTAPNKEHFQSLLDTATKSTPNFQKIDGTYRAPEGVQNTEQNPILAEDSVAVQGNGTATDQEKKRRQQPQTEEIEAVSGKTEKSAKPASLMDEVKKLNQQVAKAAHLSPEELKNQAQDIVAQLESVKTQLSSSAASEIRPSYHNLLRNRLTHIDDTLKIALSKAGVEYTPPSQVNAGALNPIERFIGFVTNSQYQLEHLSQTIDQLNLTKSQLTPGSMLALQIKVGYVQQQVELFTSLLNKALESTKTIMNVQV